MNLTASPKIPSWIPLGQNCTWRSALDGLTDSEIELINSYLQRKTYEPRTIIFRIGDVADRMLICESGRMRMYHSNEVGEEFTLFLQPEGYTVGLPSALLGEPRMVTVESVERSVMLSLPREHLFELMLRIPRFSINIAKLAASLHRESVYSTSPLALDSAAVRLGKVLARVATAQHNAKLGNYYAVLGLKQDDLASMVGISRTWLSLMLTTLENNNLLWRGRLMIGIYNLQDLLDYCAHMDSR